VSARVAIALFLGLLGGCLGDIRASTTARTAQEQLLCTTSAQRAIAAAIDSSRFAGRRVHVDVERLTSQVDQGYVRDAFEEMLIAGGARLAKAKDDAEYVIEARAAALGTYELSWSIGASLYAPGVDADHPVSIGFGYDLQEGWSRIDAFCYDAKTGKFVFGWRGKWGRAYVGIFDDIYPNASIGDSVKARVQ